MLTVSEVEGCVKNKEQFHRALILNGYYMPLLTSPICTMVFMHEVRNKTCYVPLLKDTRFLPCAYPPKCEELREKLVEIIEGH